MTTHIFILSLGGNALVSRDAVEAAMRLFEEEGSLRSRSTIYSTKALDGRSPDYLNAVAIVESALDADDMKLRLKEMERHAGRRLEDKATGIVPLDIDIVVADGAVLRPADFSRDYFQRGYKEIGL